MAQSVLFQSFSVLSADLAPRIDAALAECLQFGPGCESLLGDAMRYSVLSPGKRLRPILVVLACEACGGTLDAALPAACAVELVHAYSLIHDDLPAMDDDDLRRGRPTCHKAFGEAAAILAGDALLARAFEVLACGLPGPLAGEACRILARAAGPEFLVGGQMADLQGNFDGATLADLEFVHARKTGAIFLACLKLGGLVGGGSPTQMANLEQFGQKFGLAFQITDDMLDVHGDEVLTGKRVRKDHEQGKLTFPGLLGLQDSECRARRLVDEAVNALACFGGAARGLELLASYILERTH